jgi:trehalose transport system substrate-binding protein
MDLSDTKVLHRGSRQGFWIILGILSILVAAKVVGATTTLTLTMRLAEAEWHVMRQDVLPQFETTCQCRVRAIDVPPEVLGQRLRAMQRAGRMQIDLFAQDNMRLQELVQAGLVSPLDQGESVMDEAIHPALRQAGIISGTRYFLPFRPNVQITYYNAAKFRQYGLQVPRSWPELLAVAKTFHDREGVGRVLFKGAGGAPTTTQLYEWIVSAGGDPFDLTHPGTVQTFKFLATLRPYLSPDSRHAKWDTSNDALARESVYLAQNWSFGVPLLIREYGKTNIHTYSGWAGPAREAHVIGGDVLGIPVHAPHRRLALRLIRYLQSRDVQTVMTNKLGWPSLRSDVVVSVEDWMQPYLMSIQDALRHGVFRTPVPFWAAYDRIMNEAVQRILWRQEPPQRVLPPLAVRLKNLREER